jgi:Putative transposase
VLLETLRLYWKPPPALAVSWKRNQSAGNVTFRWKDYAHGNEKKVMTLTGCEFLRRFLLHTLPKGFVRIRQFWISCQPATPEAQSIAGETSRIRFEKQFRQRTAMKSHMTSSVPGDPRA